MAEASRVIRLKLNAQGQVLLADENPHPTHEALFLHCSGGLIHVNKDHFDNVVGPLLDLHHVIWSIVRPNREARPLPYTD